MKHARMSRQRLTAAIAIGAAVCAATSLTPAMAFPVTEAAAPDTAVDAETAAAVLSIEPGSEILSAGRTGFLTSDTDA